jgi:hypothetical protein
MAYFVRERLWKSAATGGSASMRAFHVLLAGVLAHPCASLPDEPPRRLYEITTETTMPHLEESLRYTNTREQRCLTQPELWSSFPVLQHAALKGCKLAQESRQEESLSYELICEGGSETTGRATWRLGGAQLRGTLHVKLGGKNMTFDQTVTAKLLGECSQGD